MNEKQNIEKRTKLENAVDIYTFLDGCEDIIPNLMQGIFVLFLANLFSLDYQDIILQCFKG